MGKKLKFICGHCKSASVHQIRLVLKILNEIPGTTSIGSLECYAENFWCGFKWL